MKMIKYFGVEPQAVNRWERFRYVMEKFGYSQGRVVARLPKRWISELLDCLDGVGDIERQRFIEKLRKYKEDRFVSVGDSGGGSWVERAMRLRAQGVIDEILLSAQSAAMHPEFASSTLEFVDEDFFEVQRELRCESTTENLVSAATPFLLHASEITLVDPYFKLGSTGNRKVLEAFVETACRGGRCRQITVLTDTGMKPKGGERCFMKYANEEISQIALGGFMLRVAFIDKHSPGITFHARYLLGNQGGLRYDKGFCVSLESENTDISLLDAALFRETLSWVEIQLGKDGSVDLWTWRKS